MCPWYACLSLNFTYRTYNVCDRNLLSTSNNFTTYLSAYSVFLSSIAGVIVCDYYLVRHGYYEIRQLYSAQKTSPYFFTYGIHWRAYTAYICGILINIVGFVGAIGVDVPAAAKYIYNFNFFGGFLIAAGTYYLLCWISPIPACSETWVEVRDETRNVSIVDGVHGEMYEDDDSSGERVSQYGGKGDEEAVMRERKVGSDFKG